MGNILIWHCPNPERWGAFAGGFEEVDENVEYEEREDEFDIVSHPWLVLL
jgi:COMPASS component SWD1